MTTEKKDFVPMGMTWGWLVAFAVRHANLSRQPTAAELVEWVAKDPELFPGGWPIEQAEYALTHPDELVPTLGMTRDGFTKARP